MMNVGTNIFIHTCILTHIYTHIHIHVHTYTYTIYIHSHMYTYTHIQPRKHCDDNFTLSL